MMNILQPGRLKSNPIVCSQCGKKIERADAFHHDLKLLCEDCCMDMRSPRVRKTHWRYIGSIKTEYLIQK